MNIKHPVILNALKFCAFALLFVTIVAMFSPIHWFAELLSHFQFQYFWCGLFLLPLCALVRLKRAGVATAMSLLLSAPQVIPLYFDWSGQAVSEGKNEIKLVLSNVYSGNREHNKLIEFVLDEQPDILVLQEVNERWSDKLSVLFDLYPHRHIEPRDDNFGMAVFSKINAVKHDIADFGGVNIPSIETTFNLNGRVFSLLATHPVPPISMDYYEFRNAQLLAVARRVKELDTARIVIGDLNVTTWSSDYKPLESDTGLSNTRNGFGVIPTWPVSLTPLMIPIDHVLVSQEFAVKRVYSGPDVGSDHLPLVVEVEW